MVRPWSAVVLVAAVLGVAGCGSSTTTSSPSTAQHRETMRSCMTSVGLGVKQTGPGQYNVLAADGKLSAEITTFRTVGAARRFANRLLVPGYQHGRRVVTWDTVAQSDSSQRGVISDCLGKPAA